VASLESIGYASSSVFLWYVKKLSTGRVLFSSYIAMHTATHVTD